MLLLRMTIIVVFLGMAADVALGQAGRGVQPIVAGAPNGRFQIVNGTPDMTRNIMLLDTVTGDTWILCTTEGATGWCRMPRSGTAASMEKSPSGEKSPPGFVPAQPDGKCPPGSYWTGVGCTR